MEELNVIFLSILEQYWPGIKVKAMKSKHIIMKLSCQMKKTIMVKIKIPSQS